MVRDLSIKTKLIGAFLLSAMVTAVVGGIGLSQITMNNKAFSRVATDDVVFLTAALRLNVLSLQHRRYEKNFFINTGNKEGQAQDLEQFNGVAAETQELIQVVVASIPPGADEAEDMKTALAGAGTSHEKYMKGFLEVAARAQADDTITAQSGNAMMEPLAAEIEVFEASVAALSDLSLLYINTVSEKVNTAGKRSQMVIAVLLAAGIAVSIAFGFLISGLITRPLRDAVRLAETMAKGDFTLALAEGGKDEVGTLLKALSRMTVHLKAMIAEIIGYVATLSSASTELSSISEQLSSGARDTVSQSMSVSTSADQVSANITSIAAASEQATTNVNMVATAAEEMTSTISEISKNTDAARAITSDAVSQAQAASVQVGQLGQAAQEINRVVETITEISEQVNLLALNATIEAARAGEAGKGFAVVANEIKELARQTSEAAISIRQQIESVQESSKVTVSGITSISAVVGRVNDIVTGIAAAIEEQTAVTQEIVGNVAQAALGIGDVSSNITIGSSAVVDISRDIGQVRRSIEEISTSSAQVNDSSMELSRLSEQIKSLVERFRV